MVPREWTRETALNSAYSKSKGLSPPPRIAGSKTLHLPSIDLSGELQRDHRPAGSGLQTKRHFYRRQRSFSNGLPGARHQALLFRAVHNSETTALSQALKLAQCSLAFLLVTLLHKSQQILRTRRHTFGHSCQIALPDCPEERLHGSLRRVKPGIAPRFLRQESFHLGQFLRDRDPGIDLGGEPFILGAQPIQLRALGAKLPNLVAQSKQVDTWVASLAINVGDAQFRKLFILQGQPRSLLLRLEKRFVLLVKLGKRLPLPRDREEDTGCEREGDETFSGHVSTPIVRSWHCFGVSGFHRSVGTGRFSRHCGHCRL